MAPFKSRMTNEQVGPHRAQQALDQADAPYAEDGRSANGHMAAASSAPIAQMPPMPPTSSAPSPSRRADDSVLGVPGHREHTGIGPDAQTRNIG
jgi:hypothetical protein